MAELKTKKTNASVHEYIRNITDDQTRKESKVLLKVFKEATGSRPALWGTSIVGYGVYDYTYKSGHSGQWMVTGFSPRKGKFSIYIMPGFDDLKNLLHKLGPHKIAKSCLYIKNLEDIDRKVLVKIIKASIKTMKSRYPCSL